MAREPKVIKFTEPVGVKKHKEATMRPPKGKDLKSVSHIKDPLEKDFTMINNLTGLNLTTEEWDEVDAAEVLQLQMALKGFLF